MCKIPIILTSVKKKSALRILCKVCYKNIFYIKLYRIYKLLKITIFTQVCWKYETFYQVSKTVFLYQFRFSFLQLNNTPISKNAILLASSKRQYFLIYVFFRIVLCSWVSFLSCSSFLIGAVFSFCIFQNYQVFPAKSFL